MRSNRDTEQNDIQAPASSPQVEAESAESEHEEQYSQAGPLPQAEGDFGKANAPTASERAYGGWGATQEQPTKKLSLMKRARLAIGGRKEKVLSAGHDISNQDVVLEQLAHRGAYGSIPPDQLAAWGYRQAGSAEDPESGMRAVLYVPNLEGMDAEHAAILRATYGGEPPPVLAFRGTANKRGVQDDVNRHGVGAYQFASNEGKILGMLDAAGGKVIATGHSLGGALAQLAACHFPGNVQRVVTFQSPGIPKQQADALAKHNESMPADERIRSTHHRADGDMVHLAGEALTQGDVFTFHSAGIGNPMDHTRYPLARLAAARGDLVPGVNDALLAKGKDDFGGDRLVGIEKQSTEKAKSGFMPSLSEKVRGAAGGAVRDESMERYVEVWTQVKEMIGTGAFSTKYVLGVIEVNPNLTDVQRIKMRDQVQLLAADQPQHA